MLKALFFDFGGTLADIESDARAHIEMFKEVVRRFSLDVDPKELSGKYDRLQIESYLNSDGKRYKRFIDRACEIFEIIMKDYGVELCMEDMKWFRKVYVEKHMECIELYPEVKFTLNRIRRIFDGHIGIISDADDWYISTLVERFNIADIFDSITTSDEAKYNKPHPRIFKLAFEKAGCQPEESMYIGDNYKRDILGAKSIGMKAVLILRPTRITEVESMDIPDYIIENLTELIPIIENEQRS